MTKKTILITGATGGLGKATALQLAPTGAKLVLLARDQAKLEAVANEIRTAVPTADVETLTADFSNLDSIRTAATALKQSHDQLDVLINNAGIYKQKREVVGQNLEAMFAVNFLGPWLLTTLLLDVLRASVPATIITLAAPSRTKLNFDDLQSEKKFNTFNAFGASKMADMLFTFALARKLAGSGVTANVYAPGLMKSDLMREGAMPVQVLMKLFARDPKNAATGLVKVATDPTCTSQTGQYFDQGKLKKAPAYAHSQEAQDKLWQVAETLTT